MRRAPLGSAGVSNVARAKKARKMLWCLAEGHRDLKRALWRSSAAVTSTTIFQDARKAKLSIRFNAANSNLDRRTGHLGTVDLASDHSLDSTGIQEGTMAVIRRFCSAGAPPGVHSAKKTLDVDLYQKLTTSIEMFVSDAAADEIRAGHMLAGQSVSLMAKPDLPNLKVVGRDKPHAMRRLTQRGWKADPFLDDVHRSFVTGPGSPAHLIQFSDAFAAWFAKHVQLLRGSLKAVDPHRLVKDLHYAPHRFDSMQKPLQRIALYFLAVVATMTQISQERRGGAEGQAAESFLSWLTAEKALQAAMMADAGEEHMQALRLLDYEGFPVDDLAYKLSAFLDRIKAHARKCQI